MLASFYITIHGDDEEFKPRIVRVIVHETVDILRSEAKRYHKKTGGQKKDGDFSKVDGLCHRFNMMNSDLCAVVRLAPPHIGIGIVSHELAHAAVWIWELENKFEAPLECSNDERFCWILGELVRHTTNKLYEKGVWPDAVAPVGAV